ncbi:hypothetical protein CMI37_03340, partial [Candidatus Pacearchaeota archaeon]|nr:hypothetical protein [Candidatus Pacearchaeota archaeon]
MPVNPRSMGHSFKRISSSPTANTYTTGGTLGGDNILTGSLNAGGTWTADLSALPEGGTSGSVASGATGYLPYYRSMRTVTGSTGLFWATGTSKLGIGTTSPVGKLHVSDSTSTDVVIALSNSDTGHTINDGFQFWIDTSKNAYLINREFSDMRFYTSNAQKMVLTSGGNLGIGTDSPTTKLDVRGTTLLSGNTA